MTYVYLEPTVYKLHRTLVSNVQLPNGPPLGPLTVTLVSGEEAVSSDIISLYCKLILIYISITYREPELEN